MLPPSFRAIVEAIRHPFAQAIRDLASDQMVAGRVILLGDAAAIPRPHTAASTSQAASSALDLVDALLASSKNIDAALKAWEPRQIASGKTLRRQETETGNYLLFHRPPSARIG